MTYRAIAFDLAGVLLDSEEAHANAVLRVARRAGLDPGTEASSQIRGGAYESFFDRALSLRENAHCRLSSLDLSLQAYECYFEEVRRSARLIDGAMEVLQMARATFDYVAIATSSEWRLVDEALRHFGLEDRFDAVISGDHLTQPKPAPEAYLVTAWLLGIRPTSMVVVEDSLHGIRAARRARAHVVGFSAHDDDQARDFVDAHRLVHDHRELMDYLRHLSLKGRTEKASPGR